MYFINYLKNKLDKFNNIKYFIQLEKIITLIFFLLLFLIYFLKKINKFSINI